MDGSYYVGSTKNIERRIWGHDEGIGVKYTARRRPVKLMYAAKFDNIAEVYEREKQVQGWRRAKREALICGDYDALPELARQDLTVRVQDKQEINPSYCSKRHCLKILKGYNLLI